MSEPKLERLSEEEREHMYRLIPAECVGLLALITRTDAEVRATRLSAEDVEALTWARRQVPTSYETPCTMCHDSTWDHVCDDKTTAIPEAVRFVALLDRLIGRSAP